MRRANALASCLFALLLAPAAPAQTPPTEGNSSLSASDLTTADAGYWSDERLRSATPMPMPELSEEAWKTFRYFPPGDTSPKVIEASPGSSDVSETADGQVTEADVKQRPFWNSGKLYFTTPGGDSTCTAQFVGSSRVLMTAAHCVMDAKTGAWYKNFSFRRAYNSGGGQNVGWECMSVKQAWHQGNTENYPYDYAFIYTNTDSGAGWLGFRTGTPYSNWTSVGYPINFHCCDKMGRVAGSKGTVGTGVVQMKDNPMYKGASGGAWIGDLHSETATGNYAIGLNSYATSDVTSLWGPIFDTVTYDLWQYVAQKRCTE